MKNLLAVLSAVLFVASIPALFGQVGTSMGPSPSPEGWKIAGRRMGGVSVALADRVPQLLANPANLVSLDRRHLFLTVNNARREFDFITEDYADTTAVEPRESKANMHWTQGFSLGYCAASMPFKLFQRRGVAAASYNGRQWGVFDERYVNEDMGLPYSERKRTSNVRSFSAAIGTEVVRHLRAGVSMTRWLGKQEWDHQASGNGSDDYAGYSWRVGIAGELGKLSLGSHAYLPRQIMVSRSTSGYWPGDEPVRTTLNSTGAIEIGAGYHPFAQWTFGLGYAYQGRNEVEHQSPSGSVLEGKYRGSSRFSAGIEYEMALRGFQIPLYAGYFASELSEASGSVFRTFFPSVDPAEDQFQHQLVFGAALQSRAVALHMNTTWTMNTRHYVLVSTAPPFS